MTSPEQPPGVPGPVVPLPGRTTHIEIGDVTGGPIDVAKWNAASPELRTWLINGWIQTACQLEGVDPAMWAPPYRVLIARESGGYSGGVGDPNIVNLYDENARAGVPSMGLAQVYQPNAPGENLLDPVVNIRASIRHVKEAFGTSIGKDPNTAILRVQQADPTKPPLGYQPGGPVPPEPPIPPGGIGAYHGPQIPSWYVPPTPGSWFDPNQDQVGVSKQLPTDIPEPQIIQDFRKNHPEAANWPLMRIWQQIQDDDRARYYDPKHPLPRRYDKGGGAGSAVKLPLFTDEDHPREAYAHNLPFATGAPYLTKLSPQDEKEFQAWARRTGQDDYINNPQADYDLRGYWQEYHPPGRPPFFTDTYKTPYDTTFSNLSKYATPNCPFHWSDDATLIDARDGSVVFFNPSHYASAESRPYETAPLAPLDVPGRATGGPVDMSGYGKRWHLEVQRANGSREQLPLTLKSNGGGVRNWDAGRVGLRPGDEIQLVKHRR